MADPSYGSSEVVGDGSGGGLDSDLAALSLGGGGGGDGSAGSAPAGGGVAEVVNVRWWRGALGCVNACVRVYVGQ